MSIQKRKPIEGTTEKHKLVLSNYKRNNVEQGDQKQCKTICEVYFKSILT
jgi:hypothetical protein